MIKYTEFVADIIRKPTTFRQALSDSRLFSTHHQTQLARTARTFIQSQYLKALTASLRVGFCDEWKRGLRLFENLIVLYPKEAV